MFKGCLLAVPLILCLSIQTKGAEISGNLFELEMQASLRGTPVIVSVVQNGVNLIPPVMTTDGTYRVVVSDDQIFDLNFARDGVVTRRLPGLISKAGRAMVIDVTVPEPANFACAQPCMMINPGPCASPGRVHGLRRHWR
jgi:hypothetical protein